MSKRETNTRKLTTKDHLLADQIRKLREEKGFTQKQLAEMIGRYDSYISYVEEYRRGLSLSSLYDIAEALKVKVSDLFTF